MMVPLPSENETVCGKSVRMRMRLFPRSSRLLMAPRHGAISSQSSHYLKHKSLRCARRNDDAESVCCCQQRLILPLGHDKPREARCMGKRLVLKTDTIDSFDLFTLTHPHAIVNLRNADHIPRFYRFRPPFRQVLIHFGACSRLRGTAFQVRAVKPPVALTHQAFSFGSILLPVFLVSGVVCA